MAKDAVDRAAAAEEELTGMQQQLQRAKDESQG